MNRAHALLDAADIAQAQAISLADIARERRLVLKRASKASPELIGPCPRCGRGIDRFAINTANKFSIAGFAEIRGAARFRS